MDSIISLRRFCCGYEQSRSFGNLPVNVYLSEHKKHGPFLINTGCSPLLRTKPLAFAAATAGRKLVFRDKDTINRQLLDNGYDPVCIRKVLLTDCLPESCGALAALPRYELISGAGVLAEMASGGILSGLEPDEDVSKRSPGIFKGDTILRSYYKWIFDVFGDGSVLAAEISGRCKKMTIYYFTEKSIMFVGDAVTDEAVLDSNEKPSKFAPKRTSNPKDYAENLELLRRIRYEHPEICFLTTHSKEDITF